MEGRSFESLYGWMKYLPWSYIFISTLWGFLHLAVKSRRWRTFSSALNACCQIRFFWTAIEFAGILLSSGMVWVWPEGRPMLRRSYGLADITNSLPHTPSSQYLWGSIAKAFVANLVLQQVEEGRISLDDRIIEDLKPKNKNRSKPWKILKFC